MWHKNLYFASAHNFLYFLIYISNCQIKNNNYNNNDNKGK